MVGEDIPMASPGFGHPVDAMDKLCQEWKQCQKCAMREHGDWCINENNIYGISGLDSELTFENGGPEALCTDFPWSCTRSLCECDLHFAQVCTN